ncbi:membrane protein [Bacillus andreraoultii]|uniref:membrane protein n=1 Tax=Bacillus andreraoultii TaxID=1499685 RepID=UPI000539DCD8|nr:membrane protein [Bacillus andreraoultii]
MKKTSMWSLKLSTAALVLIPIAIGINYIGKTIAAGLKLPLWLDSLGTILSSMLAGPIVGGLSGIINNLIYGITLDPISTVYAITSGVIGIVVGALAYKGWIDNFAKALLLGLVVGFIAAVVSTPLNIMFWEGQTGNVWGDALYAYVLSQNGPVWLASFLDSIVVDVPDKLISILLCFFIFKGLPKNVTRLYKNNQRFEEL